MSTSIKISALASNMDHDDGRRLYDAITAALSIGSDIQIDFSGVDVVTPSFLNTLFRVLAKQHDYAFLKSRLRIVNSNKLINSMIRDALTIG